MCVCICIYRICNLHLRRRVIIGAHVLKRKQARSCLLQNKINMIARDAEMSLYVLVYVYVARDESESTRRSLKRCRATARRESLPPHASPESAPGLF
jgi:hypothetical protein